MHSSPVARKRSYREADERYPSEMPTTPRPERSMFSIPDQVEDMPAGGELHSTTP